MKTQLHDPYSKRIVRNFFKAIWLIIGFTTNLIWWTFAKLPKTISFGLIPLSVIMASGITPQLEQEQPIIVYDTPTPTEQRLIDLRGTTWDREDIDWYINIAAEEYGVSADYMHKIIKCESNYVQDVQSNHVLSYGRELSFGLVQIHQPAHPSVSYEEAINPQFAIDFLAMHLSEGREGMWSCSRMI